MKASAQSRYFILKAGDSQSVSTGINDLEDRVRGRDEIREKPRTLVHFIFNQSISCFICFLTGFHLGKKKKGIHSSGYGSKDARNISRTMT